MIKVIYRASKQTLKHYFYKYRNFRSFTRTTDYPHRPIIAYGEKKSQQITRTGG